LLSDFYSDLTVVRLDRWQTEWNEMLVVWRSRMCGNGDFAWRLGVSLESQTG
jgi:hypothetical protein